MKRFCAFHRTGKIPTFVLSIFEASSMKKSIIPTLLWLWVSVWIGSCSNFEYIPYGADIDGPHDLHAKNIAAIKAIYKSGTLCPVSTQRCDLATPKGWATYYNLEVVIALAFRLNTYEASRIRQKVLESICQRKESGIDFLILLGDNSYLYYN